MEPESLNFSAKYDWPNWPGWLAQDLGYMVFLFLIL